MADSDCLENGSGKVGIGWVLDKLSPINLESEGTILSIISYKGFPLTLFNKKTYPDLVTWASEGIIESL